ncbi:DUF2804 domain-containing protein [Massilia sp. TSP1-1-2]|uniref:DUF2804 domain-containing protein n=1 Tax=Massilia sp. TSP1-1-2 TaxID=2804649 RepID=UPI003CEBF0F1
MTLPAAPRSIVGPDGQVALGRFCGLAEGIDWRALAPPYRRSAWWRRFHHKRWHYVALACEDVFCAVAIVDLGWTSTAFAYVFERRARQLIASFAQNGLPGLSARLADHGAGASRFRFLASQIDIGPDALTLRCAGFEVDALFHGGAPHLLAVGTVAGGSVHATQKSAGMALTGEARVGGRRIALHGGVASVDYSNGLLARETDWRWACAHSRTLGFNLQAGYFGANENALWLGGALIPLGAARFAFDAADPMAPWRIHTDCGLLNLQFTPEGLRRDDKNLLIAASKYVQPIGTFSGWVKADAKGPAIAVEALLGVTEEHRSRW